LSYMCSANLAFSNLDFANTLTFDQMPTSENFGFEFTNNLVTLAHRSNTPVASMTFKHEVRGGLLFTARETDVPTEADASVSMNPVRDTAVVMKKNAPTQGVATGAITPA